MSTSTTWEKLLEEAFKETNESMLDVIATTLTTEELNEPFDDTYGSPNGCPFNLWTANYVYFPCVYDGAEWVGHVPRHPNNIPTKHIGGY